MKTVHLVQIPPSSLSLTIKDPSVSVALRGGLGRSNPGQHLSESDLENKAGGQARRVKIRVLRFKQNALRDCVLYPAICIWFKSWSLTFKHLIPTLALKTRSWIIPKARENDRRCVEEEVARWPRTYKDALCYCLLIQDPGPRNWSVMCRFEYHVTRAVLSLALASQRLATPLTQDHGLVPSHPC